jgi:hypothetical protein
MPIKNYVLPLYLSSICKSNGTINAHNYVTKIWRQKPLLKFCSYRDCHNSGQENIFSENIFVCLLKNRVRGTKSHVLERALESDQRSRVFPVIPR